MYIIPFQKNHPLSDCLLLFCLSKPFCKQLLRPSALDRPWEGWKSGLGREAWTGLPASQRPPSPLCPPALSPLSPLCNRSRGSMSSLLADNAEGGAWPGEEDSFPMRTHTHTCTHTCTHTRWIREPFHLTQRQGHYPQGFPSAFPAGELRLMLGKKFSWGLGRGWNLAHPLMSLFPIPLTYL